jgi:hypothetical protein
MNRSILAGVVVVAIQFVGLPPAGAGVCDEITWGQGSGPVAIGLLEGGLGEGRRVCGRSEVGLGAGAMLLVDRPNFYGRLSADLRLRGSWALSDRLELFGALSSSASISSSHRLHPRRSASATPTSASISAS